MRFVEQADHLHWPRVDEQLFSFEYLLFTLYNLCTALKWVSNTNKELSQHFCSLPEWCFFLLSSTVYYFSSSIQPRVVKGMMNYTTNIWNGKMSWINIYRMEWEQYLLWYFCYMYCIQYTPSTILIIRFKVLKSTSLCHNLSKITGNTGYKHY